MQEAREQCDEGAGKEFSARSDRINQVSDQARIQQYPSDRFYPYIASLGVTFIRNRKFSASS